MKPSTIATCLADILDACTAVFLQADTNDAPADTHITHGQPAVAQGEQLIVWSPGIRPTRPFPLTKLGPVKDSIIPGLDITIELWRAIWPLADQGPTRTAIPKPADYTTAALSLAKDADALFGYIAARAAAGTLFPSLPTIGTSSDVAIYPLVPLGPQGQLCGWRFPLAVKLAIP